MSTPTGPAQQPAEEPEGEPRRILLSDEVLAVLKQIKRARSHLTVCFLTFPLYVMAVAGLLGNGQDISVLMLAYMALYAGFGINLSVKRCPRCHQQFFVKHYFLNPFPRKCAHCGLHCHHVGGTAM
jgi:hypothetical protein